MSADTLLIVLIVFLVSMYLAAMSYLHRRVLTRLQFLVWGIVALLLPALGPFLVIAVRPGRPRRSVFRPRSGLEKGA